MSYRRGTLAALVDAVVPETPGLAAERGAEHRPGGLAVGLDGALVETLDGLQEVRGPLARVADTYPYAAVVAVLLDLAAVELVVRRRTRDGLGRRDAISTRGPFTLLSRRDRLRAVGLLESGGVLASLDDRFHDRLPHLGVVRYLVQGTLALAQFAYYSEWCADVDDRGGDAVDPAAVQGWRQTGYPGPADGYAVHRGYEVAAFEEDEY